ncbi:MAG: S8 family serine peptidase [Candidatus Bathyarchaeia archaeon]
MKRTITVLTVSFLFVLILMFPSWIANQGITSAELAAESAPVQAVSFTPTVSKPEWVDQDGNRISDELGLEIADRSVNGTAQENLNVTVMLNAEPTIRDVEDFVSAGGRVTTPLWSEAVFGFGGTITYAGLEEFARKCPSLLLVEKEAVGKFCLAYAAQQVGARPYAWNTMGLLGDSAASVAVVDSGIYPSHIDFSTGYGDQDFSKKIVGWRDEVASTSSPVDENGHGTHVAGIAAGYGFTRVDGSGNALATYGTEISIPNTYYAGGGFMVNKTGTITIRVKWTATGTARLSSVWLLYGDKTLDDGSWTAVGSVAPLNSNTFYTITYSVVATPSGGYDMYHVVLQTSGTGDVNVAFTISWPYTAPSDGFPAWTGVAPQSKLVGVRVCDAEGYWTTTRLVNAINWIIANRAAYHITVASMSLGSGSVYTTVDNAITNLVNSGVTTVVSAGNNEAGSNKINSPGSVDEALTVASTNQFDNIASYSSQGGTSKSGGKTTKPDISAPGGSFYAAALFSADSDANDGAGAFADIQANDAAPMQGTSMAAPVISGCAQLVIQAMGGYASWNWTRNQALQPKMLLSMTATETYPNLRETEGSGLSPTLERGGKDAHEGYGRVNVDAAVDALSRSYVVGDVASESLGKPPATTDISGLGQRLAWARNVQLSAGLAYNFSLSVPIGADYDLYLYNSTGTAYGEPAIVTKSTNATTGGTEQFWVTAPYSGTYYLVVKRGTANTGTGAFTLTSSTPAPVTSPTLSAFNSAFRYNSVRMVYPSDKTPKPLGAAAASVSDWLASSLVSSKLTSYTEGTDVESAFVDQASGRAVGSSGIGIVTFGGPIVSPVVKYAEADGTPTPNRAPIRFQDGGNGIFYFQTWDKTAISGANLPSSVINHAEDMFVIEVYRDQDGRNILLCYGFGWQGTYAAGKYFDKVIYPNLATYNVNWIIVKWQDTNGNGFVNNPGDGDTYTQIASGADAVPRTS